MIEDSLLNIASFMPSSLESPNSWVGHLPFGGWIIQKIQPEIFVELGTHSGNSFFSFCQAAKEARISTKCYAVDSWQGDEHSGFYNEEVFAKVNAWNQEHYAGFSRLLRMSFDDAVNYFADGSIGLLHIDGFHTYEAVLHDFEIWLPKLAAGAIIMFHDTNVRENNFGVWKLWESLQTRYPNHIEFTHSHGLGVLQLDTTEEDKKLSLFNADLRAKNNLINYFSALGARQSERYESALLKKNYNGLQVILEQKEAEINEWRQRLIIDKREHTLLEQSNAEKTEIQEALINLKKECTDSLMELTVLKDIISAQEKQIRNLENRVLLLRESRSYRLGHFFLRFLKIPAIAFNHLLKNKGL